MEHSQSAHGQPATVLCEEFLMKSPFLKRLEARLRPWAIPNLTGILIAGQVVLYFARMLLAAQNRGNDPLALIYLIPSKVIEGEFWRLLSFPFEPPNTGLLFAFFGWYLFHLFGASIENDWGTTRYNIFLLLGCLVNVMATFMAWAQGVDMIASNAFLYGTVFLAFARLFPNFVINLMFILPIRIKWLALLMWISYAYGILRGDWMDRMLIVASVSNYLLFFGREHWRDLKQGQRRRSFQGKTKTATQKFTHQCLICGLNSSDSPRTLFRYCSKCSGQCCYCPDHIQDHEHIIKEDEKVDDSEFANSN